MRNSLSVLSVIIVLVNYIFLSVEEFTENNCEHMSEYRAQH